MPVVAPTQRLRHLDRGYYCLHSATIALRPLCGAVLWSDAGAVGPDCSSEGSDVVTSLVLASAVHFGTGERTFAHIRGTGARPTPLVLGVGRAFGGWHSVRHLAILIAEQP